MKKLLVIGTAVLSLVACTKETNLYDPAVIENNQKAQYAQQFVEKYGAINSAKSWDLTDFSASLTRGTAAIETKLVKGLEFDLNYKVETNFMGGYTLKNRTIDKNKSLFDAIQKVLPDGTKHEGVPVVLTAPSNSFTIYPVSVQGMWTHDLYVKVGNEKPVKLYEKRWTDFSRAYVNGEWLKGKVHWSLFDGYTFEISQKAALNGLYVEAPVGTPIEIYIANVKEGKTEMPSVGTFNGQAIYVDTDAKPEGIDMHKDAIVKYVGIEDDTTSKSDGDYNDVVLAIVGNPSVPEEIKVTDEEYTVESSTTKRYMVEDLGSTGDFDFNDVVIDVTENVKDTYKRTLTNGEVTANDLIKTEKTQSAVLRHLGGLLPFQLTIGDTVLPEMQGVLGKDLEEKFDIEGWNPLTNNISVKVRNKDNGAVFNIPFPKAGEAPMIIATPVDWEWMKENVSVPSTWFYTDF